MKLILPTKKLMESILKNGPTLHRGPIFTTESSAFGALEIPIFSIVGVQYLHGIGEMVYTSPMNWYLGERAGSSSS